MSELSIKRDWKQIDWKATLQYNVFRSVCSIPGWLLLLYFSSKQFQPIMFLLPIVYFAFWLPLGLICGWLSKLGVPLIGIITGISSVVIVFGDPVVWIIHKFKPNLVAIENPKFLDFHLIVFVIKNPEAIPHCPFVGRVVSDEHIDFMGEVFPLHKTLFIIKEDWSVETLKDKYFGFVDVNGCIKKGRLQKGIDPRETNIGEIVAYINNGICYDPQNHRLGQFDLLIESESNMISDSPTGTSNLPYSEEKHNELLSRLSEISFKRKLVKSDFPDWFKTCPFAGEVKALESIDYLGTSWSAKETVFDIDYRGIVKTPYNEDFGYIEENGDIIRDSENNIEPEKVASIKGNFCYGNNQKIGQFINQTN
jgi:hypothetical protein